MAKQKSKAPAKKTPGKMPMMPEDEMMMGKRKMMQKGKKY